MKIQAFPNSSASADWRLRLPFKHLRKLGVDAQVGGAITEETADADVYVLQSIIDKEGLALLYMNQQEHGKKIVVDCDDFLALNPDNPWAKVHEVTNAQAVIRRTMEIADLITTTTPYLAKHLRDINPNVVVLPNYLDLEFWEKPKQENKSETIRIGWAGSITHLDDLKLVVEPLSRLARDYPQVRLIFCGETRVREIFPEDVRVEVMPGVPFEFWPDRLASMRLDIGIAPLRDTPFNRAKSNIKWLEYSINKIPGVYSSTVYNFPGFDGTLGMIAEDTDHWYRILRNLVEHEILREEISQRAYAWVRREYDLSRHAQEWLKAYTSLTRS